MWKEGRAGTLSSRSEEGSYSPARSPLRSSLRMDAGSIVGSSIFVCADSLIFMFSGLPS